jgi:hypothetical protein
MRAFTAVLPALVLLAACDDTTTGPSVAIGSEFQLRPAESVAVENTDAELRFDVVTSDSRCPADAICVWQGDATAVFSVRQSSGSSSSLTLHTTGENRHASASGLTLTLVRLDPYPYASRPISPSDYRALLRVDPAADR